MEEAFTPFRIENAQSNRSNPFISAHKVGILNDHWCKNFIYVNPTVLCDELCDEIINKFEKSLYTHGETASGVNKNVKSTNDLVISKIKEWNEITDVIQRELDINIFEYNKMLTDNLNYKTNQTNNRLIPSKYTISDFQIQRYIKCSGEYIYHNDFYIQNNKYRIITFIFYLNDLIEGGETEILGCHKIIPKKGKLLLFPASWTFPHCGKMPISDNKYIITGWIYAEQ